MNWARVLERLRALARRMFPPSSPALGRYFELDDLVQEAALLVLRNAQRRQADEVADWHLRCRLLDAFDRLAGQGKPPVYAGDGRDLAAFIETPEQAYMRAEPVPPFVWLGKQHFMRWA